MMTCRTTLQFDADALVEALSAFGEDDWIPHFVESNYEGDWSVIPLRGPANETHPVRMIYSDPTCTEFVDTPFLGRVPALEEVLNAFDAPLHAVRLMKLGRASRIHPHRDHDLEVDMGMARFHVPIVTNDQVEFRLGGVRIDMKPGECWYLRLAEEHSVRNDGDVDRVHLVADVEVNAWVRSQLGFEA